MLVLVDQLHGGLKSIQDVLEEMLVPCPGLGLSRRHLFLQCKPGPPTMGDGILAVAEDGRDVPGGDVVEAVQLQTRTLLRRGVPDG
eukprot:3860412-Prymnesium_polylepis.2